MALGRFVRRIVKDAIRKQGFEIVHRSRLYEWQQSDEAPPANGGPTPEGSEAYLQPDNPRLRELQDRYRACDPAVTTAAVWTDNYLTARDLTHFRSDNPYVYQLRGKNMNELSYTLTYYASRKADSLRLFDKLDEDAQFGACTFTIDNRVVSRDLLDSVAELHFLERHLKISELSSPVILDIGAGYGRLAHRAVTALPNLGGYLCADAVAASSFICEHYLSFRGVEDRARIVPLDEVVATVENTKPQVAVNIHSFSECRIEAVRWWVQLLKRAHVPYLMVVPNIVAADNVTMLTNAREDLSAEITANGYRLLAAEPKYQDPKVQEYGINPIRHFLFGLYSWLLGIAVPYSGASAELSLLLTSC